MAKRKRARSTNGWRKDQVWHLYQDLRLSEALYLSFTSPGIVTTGWRVDREAKARQMYHATVEFGNKGMSLEDAKKYVVRYYDRLVQQLDEKLRQAESIKAKREAEKAAKALQP